MALVDFLAIQRFVFRQWARAMKHYLAVLLPTANGGWRAHFPDFPGCRAEGHSVEEAIAAACSAASEQANRLLAQGASLPQSQSYEDVRHHTNGWARERGIVWSDAVISMVPLAVQHDLEGPRT